MKKLNLPESDRQLLLYFRDTVFKTNFFIMRDNTQFFLCRYNNLSHIANNSFFSIKEMVDNCVKKNVLNILPSCENSTDCCFFSPTERFNKIKEFL